jgi:hypothetical protein
LQKDSLRQTYEEAHGENAPIWKQIEEWMTQDDNQCEGSGNKSGESEQAANATVQRKVKLAFLVWLRIPVTLFVLSVYSQHFFVDYTIGFLKFGIRRLTRTALVKCSRDSQTAVNCLCKLS